MSTPKLHVIGLPHTQTVVDGMETCAYTQKIVKFGEMMTRHAGYDVVVYSGEHNTTVCAEHVPVVTGAQQRRWFGKPDPNTLPAIASFNPADEPWRTMNGEAVYQLQARLEPHDLILLIAGYAQKPIADAFPHHLAVEWGVGYEGWFSDFVCFESHAWRHYCYGRKNLEDGRWYDTVIPNYFRPDDFALQPKDDYLLFVGRVTRRKGPHVAAEIAKQLGRKIVIAGPGVVEHKPGLVVGDGGALRIKGSHVEYVGVLGTKERAEVMGRAQALLAPTTYIEPFGGVTVEAMLCGTPAVTTDWGAFTETVQEGATGHRFRTLAEGVASVEAVGKLDPRTVRLEALFRYSLEAVAPMYDRWFRELGTLWGDGWYEMPGREAEVIPLKVADGTW